MSSKKKEKKKSSGLAMYRRTSRSLALTNKKIRKWKRYQQLNTSGDRKDPAGRWDTSGLEAHVKLLKSLLK